MTGEPAVTSQALTRALPEDSPGDGLMVGSPPMPTTTSGNPSTERHAPLQQDYKRVFGDGNTRSEGSRFNDKAALSAPRNQDPSAQQGPDLKADLPMVIRLIMAILHLVRCAVWVLMAPAAVAQFNSTVKFILTSRDAMLDFDTGSFVLDPETGYEKTSGRSSGGVHGWFVGSGFELQGRAGWKRSGQNETNDPGLATIQPANRFRSSNVTREFRLAAQNTTFRTGASPVNLSAYEFMMSWQASGLLEFHNLTVELPIRTQAPSVELLKQQTAYVPVVQSGALNPIMSVAIFLQNRNVRELIGMYQQRRDLGPPRWPTEAPSQRPPNLDKWEVIHDTLVLRNMSELSYTLPTNTTLVEVLGPVGRSNLTFDGSHCYATLDPRPSWWRNGSFPFAVGERAVNGTNRTMFLLPVDPAIKSTLQIGGVGMDTTCLVSGMKTYPFHYNYTLANIMAAGPSGSDYKDEGTSDKSGIIVGVVVGVGVPLLLAALGTWYFLLRRKRKGRKEKESHPGVEPYVVNEKELARFYSAELAAGESPSSQAAGDRRASTSAGLGDDIGPSARRIVQEEDAGDVEYLPPRYREAWQYGPEEGTPSRGEPGHMTSELSQPDEATDSPNELCATPGEPLPLKEDYIRTFASPNGSSSRDHVSTSPAPNGLSFSKDGGAGSVSRRDVKSPMGPRGPRAVPRESGLHVGLPTAPPRSELPTALEGDYKRAFP
ncbi:hypothetical protein A1Q2_04655 [Trichosporon asahii var. asahii CBS 8904]|uniref:Uncharacterized protein n=1 Tax=Trichosporon asahii var. asahii (strain CBS 8904) TaxID=1220162 RepID=K1WHV7_TRIAC|nr:hypothetical protein A1Q2_04655 [Trichosporon asahii var. asahii CBS 8904]